MRTSEWTPSIVPRKEDQEVYLIEDDLGHWGRVWTEADSGSTDLETVLSDLLSEQYSNPVRVIAFKLSEGWVRDASEDVAIELKRRCDHQGERLPASLEDFVDRYNDRAQLALPLVVWAT
jgi:hypothetical protein